MRHIFISSGYLPENVVRYNFIHVKIKNMKISGIKQIESDFMDFEICV